MPLLRSFEHHWLDRDHEHCARSEAFRGPALNKRHRRDMFIAIKNNPSQLHRSGMFQSEDLFHRSKNVTLIKRDVMPLEEFETFLLE
jgi:hypothetical protein